MADCNCRGGSTCCKLQGAAFFPKTTIPYSVTNYEKTQKTKTGSVITVYLRTEDERQIAAIAEAVADTLDLAAGRPKTSGDELPYIVTVGPIEVPEEVDEFVKMAGEGKTIIICPRPILDDNP